jgi:Flp pilus assembly protein TadB
LDEPLRAELWAQHPRWHDVAMPPDREPPQLENGGRQSPSLLTKILAVAASIVVLVGAVAISFVLFTIALTVIVAFGVYVWWKTRHLRRRLRTAPPNESTVIEGQVNWREDVDATQESGKRPNRE